jgi:hypothetical protein
MLVPQHQCKPQLFRNRTVFARSTMIRTNRPLAHLRALVHEGDTTSTKLVDPASPLRQWPQANPHTAIV